MVVNKFELITAERPGNVDVVRLRIESEQAGETLGDDTISIVLPPEVALALGASLQDRAREIMLTAAARAGWR